MHLAEGGCRCLTQNILSMLTPSTHMLCLPWLRACHRARGEEPTVVSVMACGIVSSSIGIVATYPFSLTRTRLQVGLPHTPSALYAHDRWCGCNFPHTRLQVGLPPVPSAL